MCHNAVCPPHVRRRCDTRQGLGLRFAWWLFELAESFLHIRAPVEPLLQVLQEEADSLFGGQLAFALQTHQVGDRIGRHDRLLLSQLNHIDAVPCGEQQNGRPQHECCQAAAYLILTKKVDTISASQPDCLHSLEGQPPADGSNIWRRRFVVRGSIHCLPLRAQIA